MEILFEIFWCIFFLFIWFETDAILEYSRLLGLSRLTKFNSYKKYLELNPKSSYFTFLRKYYNNFFVRLITCQPCLNFWLVLMVCCYFQNFLAYPIVYVSSYTIYMFLKKKGVY